MTKLQELRFCVALASNLRQRQDPSKWREITNLENTIDRLRLELWGPRVMVAAKNYEQMTEAARLVAPEVA